MAYVTYHGFGGVDAVMALEDRAGKTSLRFFRGLPTTEQIKAAYNMPPCANEKDQVLFDRAIELMIDGEVGYFYGLVFIMKEFSFAD